MTDNNHTSALASSASAQRTAQRTARRANKCDCVPFDDKVQIAFETYLRISAKIANKEGDLTRYLERAMRLDIVAESRYYRSPVTIPASSFVKFFYGVRAMDRHMVGLIMRGAGTLDLETDGGIDKGYVRAESVVDAAFVIRIVAAAGDYSPVVLAFLDARETSSFLNYYHTAARLGKPLTSVFRIVNKAMDIAKRLLCHLRQGLVTRLTIERWIRDKMRVRESDTEDC